MIASRALSWKKVASEAFDFDREYTPRTMPLVWCTKKTSYYHVNDYHVHSAIPIFLHTITATIQLLMNLTP